LLVLENPGSNPLGSGEVSGLSSDGTWACGIDTQNGQAFRWSAGTGVELLGNIPGFNGATGMAISDDGNTVVGFAGIAFFGITGIIWTESAGMQTFDDFAAGLGFSLPAGQTFQVMHDMTADGDKIVGYYSVDAGPFTIKTPVLIRRTDEPSGTWTDLGGGTSGINGVPALSGTGTLVAGAPTSIDLISGPSSALSLVWVSTTSTPFNVLGGTIHANPFVSEILIPLNGAGEFHATFPWFTGVPSGLELDFQFLIQDLSIFWGITLSNGLRATAP
jgi:hypothetical protein